MDSTSLLRDLPDFLRARTRVLRGDPANRGELVVYWMCTAVRSTENPALDTARIVANQLDLPLVVYHGLSARYPFASDRHHQFILEGATDVQQEFAEMGIPYLFHLERPNDPPILKQLAQRAALVVTENLPTPPIRRWMNCLHQQSRAAIWSVDTACLVSLERSKTLFKRAFAFRDALAEERELALRAPYPAESLPLPRRPSSLPIPGLTLTEHSLGTLIASCAIDHTVPPVRDTKGGSNAAKKRWTTFRDEQLRTYHRNRNDAASPAVSRMSAYLHYGHISPFQMAYEARQLPGKGPEKFLDELLIWRELAYHWCDRTSDPGAWQALPQWARDTLTEEATTPRETTYAWEQLARAKTDDSLWNLAQQSLLYHGELHNNLRMTWGKMLHHWTASPEQTLRWLIDLNHRYALDGRDPCSYGGLLWCLGLFDRPFRPANPVFGTIRTRSSAAHAKRLDCDRYERHVHREQPSQTVAVVGAGLAGLLCARTLSDQRYDVTLFDKARAPGGRASSRTSRDDHDWVFDHGVPYFSATDRRARRWLLGWENAGVLRRWNPRYAIEPERNEPTRFVGTPDNQALAKHLAQGIPFHAATRIERLQRTPSGWVVASAEAEFGPFDNVLCNLPAPQLMPLVPWVVERCPSPQFVPIHAVLVRFEKELQLDWDVSLFDHSVVRSATRENSKPGRPGLEQWLIQSNPTWSTANIDMPKEVAGAKLLEDFFELTKTEPKKPAKIQVHLWRYAVPSTPQPEGSFWEPEMGIGACGDAWGGGVQGALLSGAHLAGQVMGTRP